LWILQAESRLIGIFVFRARAPRGSMDTMTTYGIIKLNSDVKPVVALVDAEGTQDSFTETDKEEISAYFFGRPPPAISLQVAPSQDSNQRNHDRTPDYVNQNGTRFWMFHLSA